MFQKHIHKVKFYLSADDFTQALLVMLVTNIMSGFNGASRSNQRGRRIDEQRHVLLLDKCSRGQRWIWLQTDFLICALMDF